MAVERCKKCNGKKSIMHLGGLEKKCPECYGVGHVKVEEIKDKKKKKGG